MSAGFIHTAYYKEAENGVRTRCDIMDEDINGVTIDFLVPPLNWRSLEIKDAWLGEKVARAMRQVFESGKIQGKQEIREALGIK